MVYFVEEFTRYKRVFEGAHGLQLVGFGCDSVGTRLGRVCAL
jgi:hypothetical protein